MKQFLLPLVFLVMAFSVSCDDSGDDGDSNADQTYLIQFRNEFQPDTTFEDVWDTRISSVNSDTNYGANTYLNVGINTNWRTLVKFNPAGYVPPSAVITKAVLSLYSGNIFGPVTINVHTLSVSWYEDTATWNNSGGQAWEGGYDFYNEKAIASKRVSDSGASLQEVSFNLDPGAVQGWIDNPWSNQGLILVVADETTDTRFVEFYASETTYDYLRPVLTIEYRL